MAGEVVPQEPALRAWLRTRGASSTEVDDVIHETYLALAEAPRLAAITTTASHARTLAEAILGRRSASDAEAGGQGDAEGRRRLATAAAQLPASCARTFALRTIGGLTLGEVAAQCGLTTEEAEAQMAEALGLLLAGLRGPAPDIDAEASRP